MTRAGKVRDRGVMCEPPFRRTDHMTFPEVVAELEILRRAVRRYERSARERLTPSRFVDGSDLRRALTEAGWSSLDLARALGCTESTVSRWCRSEGSGVPLEQAKRITAVFVENGAEPPKFPTRQS